METNSELANRAVVKCWYCPTQPLPGIVGEKSATVTNAFKFC